MRHKGSQYPTESAVIKNLPVASSGLPSLLLIAVILALVLVTNARISLNNQVVNHAVIRTGVAPSILSEKHNRPFDRPQQISTTLHFPLVVNDVIVNSSSGDWPMVAANPQRTSWTSSELADNAHVEWYRPIDAYIPPNFQVIAANNLLYVASARGLYALQYDTGQLIWRYDTEMPLGNAPSIASINGVSMAFFGGYDKKIHALNALTGQPIWEFTGAKAGFDANPLIIGNTVYIGSRDGYFYAINAVNGQLQWQYPSAGQDGIGPIHLSPAYINGAIYFATDYNYAYAINLDGTLKWKSAKLIGDGYNSYWPVIYTNPADNKSYVIFSGNIPYREGMRPGTATYLNSPSYFYLDGISTVYQTTTLSEPWAIGKTILDYSATSLHLQQKPWQRIYTILDAANGSEFTTDFNHDNIPEYLPVWPVMNPSTQSPPMVDPNDGLIYFDNYKENARSYVMGWKFGTPYFALTSINHAHDEPQILSGGGNRIFRVLCCSRVGDYTSVTNPSSLHILWSYNLDNIAPGYDLKLFYLQKDVLSNITAQYGDVNGIYGYHGDQNPIVSYKGKAFVIRGNSVLAFGSGTPKGRLPLLTSMATQQNLVTPSASELSSRLEKEIRKIVSAGILKPGYYEDSQFTGSYYLLDNYFDNPGDTLYTLSIAYPHLSPDLQIAVRNYITNTSSGIYNLYYKNGIVNRIGWARGAQRDSVIYPAEVAADMATLQDNYSWSFNGSLSWNYPLYININPNNFYALYKYVQNIAPEMVQNVYQLEVSALTTGRCQYTDCTVVPPGATDSVLTKYPYQLNAYLAGYYGFLKLQELAGMTVQDSALRARMTTEYNRLRNLRISTFTKDTPFTTYDNGYGRNMMNISRNFVWLTTEVAADLRANDLISVQSALDEYNTVGPYWFVSRFNAATAESGFQNLYDYAALFAAKAWILNSNRDELYKWLDTPAFKVGDLFYIQNLVATIEAPPPVIVRNSQRPFPQ